jgi:predicted nucleic acid-binding protein
VAAIVIADASPLIALARVHGLGWLKALFGQVLVTEEVMAEVLSGRQAQGCGARLQGTGAAGSR